MNEALPMLIQPSLWDTHSATSSPAEDSGASPCVAPDGPTTGLCGPEAAPAPVSARQAKGRGLQTLVTSGRSGTPSSASAALQASLESRLLPRLDTAGSTLFVETWKRRATPLRRRYWEHTASARRISGSDCTSVPTPTAAPESEASHNQSSGRLHLAGDDGCDMTDDPRNGLVSQANLASVATPRTTDCSGGRLLDGKYRRTNKAGTWTCPLQLSDQVCLLTAVATPRAEASESPGAHRGQPDTLHSQTALSAVPTPRVSDDNLSRYSLETALKEMNRPNAGQSLALDAFLAVSSLSARDWKDTSGMSESGVDPDGSTRSRLDQLPRQAQLAATGPTAIGGMAETKSTGQLDSAYSRWLMGVPPAWDGFACTAMQSVSRWRKRSSKPTSKPKRQNKPLSS